MHRFKTLLLPLALACLPMAAPAAEFTLLIYEAPAEFAKRTDSGAAGQQYWQHYATYGKAMKDAGILRGGAPLQGAAEARTARLSAGAIKVASGVHAPSAQTLGGFFVIEADSLDSALAWAAKAPAASLGGAVEVRPNFPAPAMQ